ncbi:HSP20 family molecular chaperone IbpA [Bradyrhizobium sp. LM2.7]
MRTTLDFAPLWRSTIGFDHLADLVDSTLRQATEDNYPPYNIERSGEDHYRISLAVAGFGINDITVTAEQNALTIEGRKPDGAAHEYLYQGIAARPFRRVFNLADYVQGQAGLLPGRSPDRRPRPRGPGSDEAAPDRDRGRRTCGIADRAEESSLDA